MSNSDIVIRRGQLEDVPILAKFNIDMARETENRTLDAPTIGNVSTNCVPCRGVL